MEKSKVGRVGWLFGLALALAIPSLPLAAHATGTKASKSAKPASGDESGAGTAGSMSKEDQEKVKEHNKLRAEIGKVKYPAAKADIVAHVKGIKADDKKWFSETLPAKTYTSPDEVYSALGWEATPPATK